LLPENEDAQLAKLIEKEVDVENKAI